MDINNMKMNVNGMVSKFASDTKLGGIVDVVEGFKGSNKIWRNKIE